MKGNHQIHDKCLRWKSVLASKRDKQKTVSRLVSSDRQMNLAHTKGRSPQSVDLQCWPTFQVFSDTFWATSINENPLLWWQTIMDIPIYSIRLWFSNVFHWPKWSPQWSPQQASRWLPGALWHLRGGPGHSEPRNSRPFPTRCSIRTAMSPLNETVSGVVFYHVLSVGIPLHHFFTIKSASQSWLYNPWLIDRLDFLRLVCR